MNTAASAIQPSASQLVSHTVLLERIRRLGESPRVWTGIAGYSHQGREIPYIVVASPDAINELEYHRRATRRLFHPAERLETLAALRYDPPDDAPVARPPVLIVGSSFGNEAAHTEAILEVADQLAYSDDPSVRDVLDRVITILIPLINPDGREAALREWTDRPRSPALVGSVNAWGSMLNRDFFALTQPESRALLNVYREWHPLAAYDPHEDMYLLGVRWPQICWTPPFSRPIHPELHPSVVAMINAMGNAIADAWRREGFNMLHDRDGNHGFMTLFRLGGRFHLCMALHGVPALITESARTPGSQSWEDRTKQKVMASFAVLTMVARDPARFGEAIRASRRAGDEHDAYVVPKDQLDHDALRQLVGTLALHEVRIYETDTPSPAYVIPTHQPDGRLVRSLLGTAGWNFVSMIPSLGIRGGLASRLPEAERAARFSAPLTPVLGPRPAVGSVPGRPRPAVELAIRNTVAGVRTLNRLWAYGLRTSWTTAPLEAAGRRLETGTFVIDGSTAQVVEQAMDGNHPVVSRLDRRVDRSVLRRLRAPRVALYVGQGVDDRYMAVTGDTRWACLQMGFSPIEITEADVRLDILKRFDVLIVPGGDAAEIVAGRGESQPWQREPWEQQGPRRGIGQRGLAAIRRFVERGGSYVGLGCGGATLGGTEFLGLADVQTERDSLGEGRVRIRILSPDHPIMAGLAEGSISNGESQAPIIPGYYYSELTAGIKGGPIFVAGSGVRVLAAYAGFDDGTAETSFTSPELLSAERRTPAVVHSEYGRGTATLFGISPDFRGIWWSTYVLLSNSIFAAAAG